MSENKENDVLAYIDDDGVCRIKLIGEIRYNSSAKGFIDFVSEKVAEDEVKDVIVDLRKCDYIDSTNIGVLAKIATIQKDKDAPKKPTLIYCRESKVNSAIEDVSINPLFDVRFCGTNENGNNPLDDGYNYKRLPKEETTKLEISKIMYATHKILSDLSETNKEKFKSVVECLAESVQKKH
jgi:anti-anti-sigma factor